MQDTDAQEASRKRNIKIIALVIVIVLFGVVLYLMFVGLSPSDRDDNVSLSQINAERKENTVVLFFWGGGCQPCNDQKPYIMNPHQIVIAIRILFFFDFILNFSVFHSKRSKYNTHIYPLSKI